MSDGKGRKHVTGNKRGKKTQSVKSAGMKCGRWKAREKTCKLWTAREKSVKKEAWSQIWFEHVSRVCSTTSVKRVKQHRVKSETD